MNWKRVLSNSLLIAVLIALIAFIPDAGDRVLSWFLPPRLYILLAVVALLILYKILLELRNRRNDDE